MGWLRVFGGEEALGAGPFACRVTSGKEAPSSQALAAWEEGIFLCGCWVAPVSINANCCQFGFDFIWQPVVASDVIGHRCSEETRYRVAAQVFDTAINKDC